MNNEEPKVIIHWTDIRTSLPPEPGWCLVKRDVGLCQYGWTIRDAVWWDGKQFWADSPNVGTPIEMRDYTAEYWGDIPGIVAWAYMSRPAPDGGWQFCSRQTTT